MIFSPPWWEVIMAWSRRWPMTMLRWILNRFFIPLPISRLALFSLHLPLPTFSCTSQSPACPTSPLPQVPSSPRITQKATGTTWTASGSSNRSPAPGSTWHLMTSTWRRRMIPWRWKTARRMTLLSSGGSRGPRVRRIWRPIPTRWDWSFKPITPCREEDLTSLIVVCLLISPLKVM